MGAGEIEDAAENLLRLRRIVDTEKMSESSFLMVLTDTDYAFRLKNGVWVVPIGCLKIWPCSRSGLLDMRARLCYNV